MGLKKLFLQKGWAGKTISREETVERLNALLREVSRLHLFYGSVEPNAGLGTLQNEQMKILRADIGKLCETVFSCGGLAYNGTDLEPGDFSVGDDPVATLLDLEKGVLSSLAEEDRLEHQMRTRAILDAVRTNVRNRINLLAARN